MRKIAVHVEQNQGLLSSVLGSSKFRAAKLKNTRIPKQCSCGKINRGSYPEDINTPVSYGAYVQILVTYMHARQFIPYERLREFFNSFKGTAINYCMM